MHHPFHIHVYGKVYWERVSQFKIQLYRQWLLYKPQFNTRKTYIFARTPMRAAEIWEKQIYICWKHFYHLIGITVNFFFALHLCLCASISFTPFLFYKRTARNAMGWKRLISRYYMASYTNNNLTLFLFSYFQNCSELLVYLHRSFSPWRRSVFKPKYWANLFKYIFCCFIILFPFSSLHIFYKLLFIFIVLIQVYNWENWHLSTVCCCRLADILYFCTS